MKRKVVSYKNLPVRPPLPLTLILYVMYDLGHFNNFWAGLIAFLMVILWINYIVYKATQEENDIFEDKP